MLAYHVAWHMRNALAPILHDDDDPQGAQAQHTSIGAPAQRSVSANQKAKRKRNNEDLPVHSFQTLLKDLATICKETIKPRLPDAPPFEKVTLPTPLQQRALQLLRITL